MIEPREDEEEPEPCCEYCGDKPVDRAVQMRDVTPTDRGDWVQTYTMDLCSACADKLEGPISL